MSQFIDFAELKRELSIEAVAEWLGLDLKRMTNGQLRGACPIEGGDRLFTITPDFINKDGTCGRFFCFANECRRRWPRGGDVIELVAKVHQLKPQDAAAELQKAFQTPQTAPQATKLPEGGLDYLLADHEAVQALGLSKEQAVRLGIGFAPKGIMRGRICFPLRDPEGKLLGYCGYAEGMEPALKFPIKFL